jgi:hypothetical protein
MIPRDSKPNRASDSIEQFRDSLTNFYLVITANWPGVSERLGEHQVNNMHGPTARTFFIETRQGIAKL